MRIETQKKWRTLIKQHADSDLSISVEKFPPVSVQKFPLSLGYLRCF